MESIARLRYNRQVNRHVYHLFRKEVNHMGNRNINNKETKKKKKNDIGAPSSSVLKSVVAQPEIIKKPKKVTKDE